MYEASRCKGCGVDLQLASDPAQVWNVEEHVCYSCRAVELMKRKVQHDHKSEPQPGVAHPLDGRVLFVEPHYN